MIHTTDANTQPAKPAAAPIRNAASPATSPAPDAPAMPADNATQAPTPPASGDGFSIRQAIVRSIKQNLWPGLCLQAFAFGILIAYYWHAPTHNALQALAALRDRVGFPYAFVSTALFGGLVPFLVQRARPSQRWRTPWRDLPFFVIFWGLMGLLVDRLYVVQTMLFGHGSDVQTVASKVAFDQAVFAPFVAIPLIAFAYQFKDLGYRPLPALKALNGRWVHREVLPMLFANAMVWVPTCVVLYLLPLALQLPIQNIVQCFWSILILYLSSPPATPAPIATDCDAPTSRQAHH